MLISGPTNFGKFENGNYLYVQFSTYDAAGASVTCTDFDVSSIKVYHTENNVFRASASGIVLLDTDGIDIGGTVGLHGFYIDTADDDDPGFYIANRDYFVVVEGITVDSQVVNACVAIFTLDDPQDLFEIATAIYEELASSRFKTQNFGNVSSATPLVILFDGTNDINYDVTNIKVFKGGVETPRASISGYTLLGTDGYSFGGVTCLNGFSIDPTDDDDPGFYTESSSYSVVLQDALVTNEVVGLLLATFTLGTVADGDPWATDLPGAYTSGQAGKIIGDNLDATVSSRASQTSVNALQADAEAKNRKETQLRLEAASDAITRRGPSATP